MCIRDKQKWLEAHGDTHWLEFYTDYGISLQKRFFGYFLKGEDTGWSKQPAVQLLVRADGPRGMGRMHGVRKQHGLVVAQGIQQLFVALNKSLLLFFVELARDDVRLVIFKT